MPARDSPQFDADPTRSKMFDEIKNVNDPAVREKAWRELYCKYVPAITAYVKKRGFGRHVDEVVQLVLVGFLSASPNYQYDRSKGRFTNYLFQCSRNAIAKICKKEAATQTVAIESVPEPSEPKDEESFVQEIRREWWRRAVAHVRQRYSDETRKRTFQAWELNVVENIPAPEVAMRLGIQVASVHTAKKRVSEAVALKAREIEEEED